VTTLFARILRRADGILPIGVADAHCDIPCGIYHPHAALQAADTVIKMTALIQDLEKKGSCDLAACHDMARYVMIKEQHAAQAKAELLILWTDYFKPEHLERWPDLHAKVWAACKLGSAAKQKADLAQAEAFKAAIQEIAIIFNESRK
jgi:nickel superoxide dismutase